MFRVSRKSKTDALVAQLLDQRVPLAIAAHYVRVQLAADRGAIYDSQHFIDMIDIAGAALIRVAPVYTLDAAGAEPRLLAASELDDATVQRAATAVVLRDGRTLSSVFIKRGDLRQALAALRAVGVPELQSE